MTYVYVTMALHLLFLRISEMIVSWHCCFLLAIFLSDY